MEAVEKLAADIQAETLKALEYAKSEAARILEEATNKAKQRIEAVIDILRKRLEDIKASVDKIESDVKNDIEIVCVENVNAVHQIENEAIKTLNTVWEESKNKMESVCTNALGTLGGTMLADTLKDLIKFCEKLLTEAIQVVQDYAEAAVKEIGVILDGIKKILTRSECSPSQPDT